MREILGLNFARTEYQRAIDRSRLPESCAKCSKRVAILDFHSSPSAFPMDTKDGRVHVGHVSSSA